MIFHGSLWSVRQAVRGSQQQPGWCCSGAASGGEVGAGAAAPGGSKARRCWAPQRSLHLVGEPFMSTGRGLEAEQRTCKLATRLWRLFRGTPVTGVLQLQTYTLRTVRCRRDHAEHRAERRPRSPAAAANPEDGPCCWTLDLHQPALRMYTDTRVVDRHITTRSRSMDTWSWQHSGTVSSCQPLEVQPFPAAEMCGRLGHIRPRILDRSALRLWWITYMQFTKIKQVRAKMEEHGLGASRPRSREIAVQC